MRSRKRTKEERAKKPKPEESRPIEEKDLEALLKHFGQTKNLPK